MVRFKNRYLLTELQWEDDKRPQELNSFLILNTIKESIQSNFGDFGIGSIQMSLQVKYFNPVTNICIIRGSRNYFQMLWNSVTFINNMKKIPVSFCVLHVGGTMKLCQKAAIKYDKELLLIAQFEKDDVNDMDTKN